MSAMLHPKNAFRAMRGALNARGNGKGMSIIVRDPEAAKVNLPGGSTNLPATTAVYSLRNTLEVEQFLTTLATLEEMVSGVFDKQWRRLRLLYLAALYPFLVF